MVIQYFVLRILCNKEGPEIKFLLNNCFYQQILISFTATIYYYIRVVKGTRKLILRALKSKKTRHQNRNLACYELDLWWMPLQNDLDTHIKKNSLL